MLADRAKCCEDCGIEIPQPRANNRKFCGECRQLRDAEAGNRNATAWRARNPEKVKQIKRASWIRHGGKTWAEYCTAKRARADALVPTVETYLSQGLSYSQIGERIGVGRNAVAGLVHRLRKRSALT